MAFRLRAEGLDYADEAPVVIEETLDVAASPQHVWAAIADTAAWEQWFAGMKSCRYTSAEPIGSGSKRTVQVAALKIEETMLAVDAPTRYAFRIDTANLPLFAALIEVVDLVATDSGTLVRYRQCLEFRRWAKPFAKLLTPQIQRGLRRGLSGLGPYVVSNSTT